LGGACSTGQCAPIAIVTTGYPRYVAVDDKSIYWTDSSTETVWKVPKGGGSTKVKVTDSPGTDINGLVIDSANAYFSFDHQSDGGTPGGIASAPLAGAKATVLSGSQNLPSGLVLAPTGELYWVQSGLDPQPVMHRDTSGKTSEVGRGDEGAEQVWLSIANGKLYIANDTVAGTLKRCALPACGGLETLVTNESGIGGATETSTHLIWCNAVIPGTIYQAQPDGGASEAVTAEASHPHTFMVSTLGRHLYWLNAGPSSGGDYPQGSVMRCPMTAGTIHCGSGPETLSRDNAHIRGLIQDETSLYWVSDGKIWRLAK
jgi:hypothetical protein